MLHANARHLLLLVLVLCAFASMPFASKSQTEGGDVVVLTVNGAIGPALGTWIRDSIAQAEMNAAHLVVLRLDTPGGLDTAMRDIIQGILDANVPIATYVWPQGARAASAGTYILYASHVAAMAPATNLGAATPVSLVPSSRPDDGDANANDANDANENSTAMERKVVNDAVAYIRGLAERNGRNADWAERAVRNAESLPARDALENDVIDLIASDVDDLLGQLQGRDVRVQRGTVTLAPAGRNLLYVDMDWRTKLLTVLTNPSLIMILGMLGIYGLIIEFYTPGFGLGGIVGVTCLLLAGYGLQLLPINYAGLALLLLGVGLMLAEAFAPSFGILGIGGIVAFVFGGLMLIDTDVDVFRVSVPMLAAIAVFSALLLSLTARMFVRIRATKVVSGLHTMLGQIGESLDSFAEDGVVKVQGEIWQAHTDTPLQRGDRVKVVNIDGLRLHVTKAQ
ncbi:MAG: nodulation protein NfeD [Pseudomonadota bacterium]|nr:nodulation protein NfeD [Pseudomonadota bacterium]